MTDSQTILMLETLAANAWPAAEVELCGGWRLRSTHGVTRRANSVWPNHDDGALPLAAKLAQVEAFYAARQRRTVYQICEAMQPAHLDAVLAKRGYFLEAPTFVQTAPLATLLDRLPPSHQDAAVVVQVSEAFNAQWFEFYCISEQVSIDAAPVRRAILERIAPVHSFVTLLLDGAVAALGLGVVEEGWLGIFSMATMPAFRRRGAARTVLHTLAKWAHRHDARCAYLQVMEENLPAQQLYASTGFTTAYRYHYRVKG